VRFRNKLPAQANAYHAIGFIPPSSAWPEPECKEDLDSDELLKSQPHRMHTYAWK